MCWFFVRVSETGNFTSAAEKITDFTFRCRKMPSARLGKPCQYPFVSPDHTAVCVSMEEGERFYLHAKRILSEVDDAENALYKGRLKPSGTLRVAVPWFLAAIM